MNNYIDFWLSKYMIESIGTGLFLLVIVIVGLISSFIKHIKKRGEMKYDKRNNNKSK